MWIALFAQKVRAYSAKTTNAELKQRGMYMLSLCTHHTYLPLEAPHLTNLHTSATNHISLYTTSPEHEQPPSVPPFFIAYF